MIRIIGAGLTGCTLAYLLKDKGVRVYERERLSGGLCRQNRMYQNYIHIFHTDYEDVWNIVHMFIKPYTHRCMTYTKGEYLEWPPLTIDADCIQRQILPYGFKMWGTAPTLEALSRIHPGPFFHDKYQGILDIDEYCYKCLDDCDYYHTKDVRYDNIKTGTIILTGRVDEFFGYGYGELEYRGMGSMHMPYTQRLKAPCINFSDLDIPFIRMIDYKQLGFGDYIGIEYPDNSHKYPVNDDKNKELYAKYKKLADDNGIILAGRLGTYRYLDMDDCIKEALDLAEKLK